MNYLTFHADKYNITQEQLDNARLSGAKNSPMMEGIEHCINQVDDAVMQELIPRIIHTIKKGTGLPTKVRCSTVCCAHLWCTDIHFRLAAPDSSSHW